ncbi:MAG: undecaprenyldiphospho-muramoylpentapeptide beta-N-acetylglucosaminyltransferase [Gammaproteobacteria bacterium]|nr:undecaprenyldiphospho-muramoylpentapeptide beta-N-acetylglucosaminyltransferase [Gammaproteobacteria bacterium]
MKNKMNKTILIMAAGTGGHIFPGLAIAHQFRDNDFNVVWLGTKHGMENQIVPAHQFPIETIAMKGLRNNGLLRLLMLPVQLLKAMYQVFKIIKRLKPDLTIGMGGYVSAPGGLMSWITRTPLLIHEQNSRAGLSNKLLNLLAQKTLCAFPKVTEEFYRKTTIKLTGNPVREDIIAIDRQTNANDKNTLNILVLGGSLGAQQLNTIVPQAIDKFIQSSNIYQQVNVKHQTGKNKSIDSANNKTLNINYQYIEFIDDMAEAYLWANIAICRAGALTISEIAISQLPAIFVPYPYAVDDHQTTNAKYLVDNDAAYLINDRTLSADGLIDVLNELTPNRLNTMQENLKSLAKPNATNEIYEQCLKLMNIQPAALKNETNEVNHHA